MEPAAQGAVDADDNLSLVGRENRRIQVLDNRLNYVREFANEGWNPWDIAISGRGDDGFGYIADHAGERVHKAGRAGRTGSEARRPWRRTPRRGAIATRAGRTR